MAKSKAKAPSRPKGSLTDAQKALLDKPELLAGLLTAAFFMYRAKTVKGLIGSAGLLMQARRAGYKPRDAIFQLLTGQRPELLKDWDKVQKYKNEMELWIKRKDAMLRLAELIPDQDALNVYTVKHLDRSDGAAVKQFWDLVYEAWDWVKNPSNHLPPTIPDDIRFMVWSQLKPTAGEIAALGLMGFIIGSKPELVVEGMKGMGEMLKGIGEIVPL